MERTKFEIRTTLLGFERGAHRTEDKGYVTHEFAIFETEGMPTEIAIEGCANPENSWLAGYRLWNGDFIEDDFPGHISVATAVTQFEMEATGPRYRLTVNGRENPNDLTYRYMVIVDLLEESEFPVARFEGQFESRIVPGSNARTTALVDSRVNVGRTLRSNYEIASELQQIAESFCV